MKKIKKIITLVTLAACAALMLCSCGNKKALASISVASPINLQLGESKQVELTGVLRDGTTVTGDELAAILERKGLRFESMADSVASIDANGRLTANGHGTTEISIYSQNNRLTAGAVVNVVEPLQGFELDDIYASTKSELVQVEYTTIPENADAGNVTVTVEDESIARVDENNNTVTFPDEYPTGTDLDGNELELAGKEAVFRTTLKEVDEVTLTDENVKDNIATQDAFVLNDGSAVDTVDKLNQFYNEKYEQDALSTAVFNYVVENSSISEIPQQLLDDQRESYRQEIQAAIASYDMTEDEYFQQVGVDSMDALLDTYADQIKESVSDFLIFQAVAEEQKIKVTDDDVSNYFGGDALSVKQAKAYYGEAYLNQNVLYEKVYTWLVDHASIV